MARVHLSFQGETRGLNAPLVAVAGVVAGAVTGAAVVAGAVGAVGTGAGPPLGAVPLLAQSVVPSAKMHSTQATAHTCIGRGFSVVPMATHLEYQQAWFELA